MRRPRNVSLLPSFFILLTLTAVFQIKAQEYPPSSPRLALVIGNGNYSGLNKLANPVNDASDMGDALAQLGFSVEVLTDSGLEAFENAVLSFRDKLAGNPDAVGLFFYAGHGLQSGGENYLIPVDVQIPSESLLRTRAVPLQFVLESLREAKNKLNVVILDACRDNPFAWARSGARGLSIVGAQPPGSIVVYSTSAGSTAQDGLGRNGTFTDELLDHLTQPGLEINEIFRRTGAGVQEKTSGAQIPAVYSQFFGHFYPGATQASSTAPESTQEEPSELFFLPAFFEDAPEYAKKLVAAAEEYSCYGQWLSAWYTLLDTDPPGKDPYILAKKVDIALRGYVDQDNFRGFAFADLTEGEELEDIRYTGENDPEFFDFDPHAQFAEMGNRGIDIPPILSLAMGDYYYTVWFNYVEYSEDWVQSQEEAFDSAMRCYQKAEEAYILVTTPQMLRYVDLLMELGLSDKSIEILLEVLDWEPENIEARKTLAEAYAANQNFDEAFAQYDNLASLQPAGEQAYDAYSRAADTALLHDRPREFEKYVKALETFFPDDWLSVLFRHKMAVSNMDWDSARVLAVDGMRKFRGEVFLLDSLLGSWLLTSDGYLRGFSFLEDQILSARNESEQLALLLFYRAAYRFYGVRSTILDHTQTQIHLIEEDLGESEALYAKLSFGDGEMKSNIRLMREQLETFALR